MRRLKLGTRRSLLAWAQSSWVAREIERASEGRVSVELVGIETRGDRILDVPLSQVQGKEFFVAEIDEALRSGAVDLTVHSMKDLSLDRPGELCLAAAPRRENPRDVVIFGPEVVDRIRQGRPLRIGTSAPRRLENIPGFLSKALPQLGPQGAPALDFQEIRGNVNTRLSRLREPASSPRALDGVVLAFAGLIRLWRDEAGGGQRELAALMKDCRWMVLPLAECPTAPAQGMLAVECRASDPQVFEAIRRIHDPVTFAQVELERELLRQWGGGCHQKFGATAIVHPKLGEMFYVRGRHPDGFLVDELRWREPARPDSRGVRAWDGTAERAKAVESVQALESGPLARAASTSGRAVFVAHSRAVEGWAFEGSERIWTSGTASWFRLAKRGLWVEGSAEGLGIDSITQTLSEPVLRLAPLSDWVVLTHEGAASGWDEGHVIPTYQLRYRRDSGTDTLEALRTATHVYWSSGSQFEALGKTATAVRHHACGPGKTADVLAAAGLRPEIFPSAEVWRRWINA